jgi:hypothetical protein
MQVQLLLEQLSVVAGMLLAAVLDCNPAAYAAV